VEDGERLGEWAQEGGIGLKEEVAEVNRELLGLEDLFERVEALNEFYSGGVVVDTAKYDVLLCMASGPVCGTWVGYMQAYGDIFSSRAEMVRVIHIKTVHNCDAKESGSDEMMAHSNGALYTQRGFVAVGGCTGDVGGMVGRGVIHKDFLPHSLFGWGVVI
jgi:hypothetical protein